MKKKTTKKQAVEVIHDDNGNFTRFGAFDWKFEHSSITGKHSAYGTHHCSVTEGEGYLRIKPHRANGTARQTKLQRTINEIAHNNMNGTVFFSPGRSQVNITMSFMRGSETPDNLHKLIDELCPENFALMMIEKEETLW